MKLLYISTTNYSDTDFSILKTLTGSIDLVYLVIVPATRSNYDEYSITRYCNDFGIKYQLVKLKHRRRNPLNIITYVKVFVEVLKIRANVCFFNNYDELLFNIMVVLFLRRNKTVIGFHDVVNHSGLNNYIFKVSKGILIKSFKYFLTFSRGQKKLLRSIVTQDKTIFTIPLPLKNFGELVKTKRKQRKNLLFFGNISSYKGLDILIEAINTIPGNQDVLLTIAGRCDNWEFEYLPLIRDINRFNLKIEFIKDSEIAELFSRTDYLVLPYRDATQSGPLMIALYYSIPAIVSNIEGLCEFIEDGKTGFIFERENISDLSKTLQKALMISDAEYTNMENNISMFVEKELKINKITSAYIEMFENVHRQS